MHSRFEDWLVAEHGQAKCAPGDIAVDRGRQPVSAPLPFAKVPGRTGVSMWGRGCRGDAHPGPPLAGVEATGVGAQFSLMFFVDRRTPSARWPTCRLGGTPPTVTTAIKPGRGRTHREPNRQRELVAQAVSSTEVDHPLAALTVGEIAAAVALVQADPTFAESTRFAYVGLIEPTREQVRAWAPGHPVDRRVRLMLVPGPEAFIVEAVASLRTGELSMTDVPGARPGLLFEESFTAIVAVQENAQWQAPRRRGGEENPRAG